MKYAREMLLETKNCVVQTRKSNSFRLCDLLLSNHDSPIQCSFRRTLRRYHVCDFLRSRDSFLSYVFGMCTLRGEVERGSLYEWVFEVFDHNFLHEFVKSL